MIYFRWCLFLAGLGCFSTLYAQHTGPAGKLSPESVAKMHAAEDTLALLAYAVVNDTVEKERFAACKVLIKQLVQTLKTENSYKYPFDRLKMMSIMAPPDSSFRIFTWQLPVNDSTNRYYGAIQMNQSQLKLFPLIDRSMELEPPPAYENLKPDRWYGVLYYNIRPFSTREGTKYLMFGYDGLDAHTRRKLIDVLWFDKSGNPVFGAPVFRRNPPGRQPELRLVFEYDSAGSVKVNWDEQYQMVLFDHLIAIPSPNGNGISRVTDGSYDGLKYEKGVWNFVSQVFHDVMNTAPRPEPILDNRKDKNILGKSKDQKKPGAKKG